ncbi:duf21 and cbs domain protein [Streptomyces laurentii]|uniref:Duf21 and cbs domain protein n=1 Tax=Streptomyces laurentii TaxID=39478 RepID=A0A160NWI9_STRLU|nr:duf21 and cbs domain protein [Streptomyces laurentii]
MTRELLNVRLLPADDGPTPLTDEEERRCQAVLFGELGDTIAGRGWARYPAYTPEDRRRLVGVAARLTAHWGQRVYVEAEDPTRVRLSLAGYGITGTTGGTGITGAA